MDSSFDPMPETPISTRHPLWPSLRHPSSALHRHSVLVRVLDPGCMRRSGSVAAVSRLFDLAQPTHVFHEAQIQARKSVTEERQLLAVRLSSRTLVLPCNGFSQRVFDSSP